MPHFLINSKDVNASLIKVLDSETLKHLVSAMRVKTGEELKFIDENEMQYVCEVSDVSKKCLCAKVLKTFKSPCRLGFDLYLALSVLKQDAQNLAVENATQLGVRGIYPVITDNSTVSEAVAKAKTQKWQKVAFESFKQCERADVPTVFEVSTLENVLGKFKNVVIFTERDANTTLSKALEGATGDVLAVVGPEGGFSKNEFEMFKKFNCVSLGNLILKAPNAVSVGLGNIINEYYRKN